MMILLVSSLAILDAERDADHAQITSFADALWWSVVTASTVGYGDFVPQSTTGRIVASVLMFAAIGLVGLVSGALASWFVDRVKVQDDGDGRAEADQLSRRLAALETQVAEIHAVMVRGERPDGTALPEQPNAEEAESLDERRT